MKLYKCIRELSIPKCDGDGFETGKYKYIKKGSIWTVPEDNFRLLGGDIRLESNKYGWIEISKETLGESFEIYNKTKRYRVWHGLKGWIKHMDIIEATTAAEAIVIAQGIYKQHRISSAKLISK